MRSSKTLKIFITGMVLLCSLMFINACTSDAIYNLPNDYKIIKVNSKTVTLCEEDPEIKDVYHSIIQDYHVTSFCIIEQYVAVAGYEVDNGFIDENYEETRFVYYVFDTENKEIFGAFSNSQKLKAKLNELGFDQEIDWSKTGSEATEPNKTGDGSKPLKKS